MQTFLPYPDFTRSAQVLDRQRLGKQRIEARQIIETIESGRISGGWVNHPAVNMWRGHIPALACYGVAICDEWIRRGYKDAQRPFFAARAAPFVYPAWLTPAFCLSHQSNLLRKNRLHYSSHFGLDLRDDLPYLWPV